MKRLILLLLATVILAGGCNTAPPTWSESSVVTSTASDPAGTDSIPTVIEPLSTEDVSLRRDLLVLLLAYQDELSGIILRDDGIFVKTSSGDEILYDDHQDKTFDQKLGGADLQDMLEQPYPLDPISTLMPEGMDPGRFRCHAFFEAIYGRDKSAVQENLTSVRWGDVNVPFNALAGAAESLAEVSGRITSLAADDPDIRSIAYPSAGTFNYRLVAGTDYLSFHAYGIAIDLNSHEQDYWRWANAVDGQARLAAYPAALVIAFEESGFIWGGKWHHFDIMHYEYRPELILKSRLFSDPINPDLPWYDGANQDDSFCLSLIAYLEGQLSTSADD